MNLRRLGVLFLPRRAWKLSLMRSRYSRRAAIQSSINSKFQRYAMSRKTRPTLNRQTSKPKWPDMILCDLLSTLGKISLSWNYDRSQKLPYKRYDDPHNLSLKEMRRTENGWLHLQLDSQPPQDLSSGVDLCHYNFSPHGYTQHGNDSTTPEGTQFCAARVSLKGDGLLLSLHQWSTTFRELEIVFERTERGL